jgi:hypothetical protein
MLKNATCSRDPGQPMSHKYLLVSLYIFLGGIVIILMGRFFVYIVDTYRRYRRRNSIDELDEMYDYHDEMPNAWYLNFKELMGNLVSGGSLPGRIMVITLFMFNLIACAIYITESAYPVEYYGAGTSSIITNIELVIYCFFIIHLFIRFLAANDKLVFWVSDILTLADLFTIPTVINAVICEHNWIGMFVSM